MNKQTKIKPFLKWVGGKKQLLPVLSKHYPKDIGKSINRYCEPCVGGGAVLFDILASYKMEEVLICDINKELINCYIQVRDNVSKLLNLLSEHQNKFCRLDIHNRSNYYYQQRNEYNEHKSSLANIELAALFIFLNKTCFNGLYRVNYKGEYNVPIGSYKNPLICNEPVLLAASQSLANVDIVCGDYQTCRSFVDEHTLVYIDPPYRPLSKTANFTAYSKAFFTDADQAELKNFVDILSAQGAKIILSNSDPKNIDVNDNFFDELYADYHIQRVNVKRVINSNGNKRGKITELLISN